MNLIVNSLPTRTWNHLKMNEALVDLEADYRNKSPEVLSQGDHMTWNIQEAYASQAALDLQPVLGNALIGFGETKENEVMETPLVIRYGYEYGEKAVSRLAFHAAEGSRLKVVILLDAKEKAGETAVLETEVYADKDAKAELYVVQLLSENGRCVNHIAGICGDSANVTLTRLELGSGHLYSGVNLDLQGKESAFNAEVGYHARPGQSLDMNYVALHEGKKSESLMEINGTLENGSKKVFRGTIDFRQGCAGAKGTENENVLLMGEDVVNQTIPVILCKEEDVEGNHGASIGQLDDKILFYLGSRGISQAAAQQMIAQARIEAICAKLPSEAVQQQVREFENTRGISHGAEL